MLRANQSSNISKSEVRSPILVSMSRYRASDNKYPCSSMRIPIDFLGLEIATMGIRVLVLVIIFELCLLNSRSIAAWPIASAVSRGALGRAKTSESIGLRLETPGWQKKQRDGWTKFRHTDSDWSQLILTLQWPESFCLSYNDSQSDPQSKSCVIPASVNDWTIHGLWPSVPGTETPSYCNKTWEFDLHDIADLEAEMNASWPDFLTNSQYYNLWSHEWDKHGTCASTLPALYGEHAYFKKTLDLRKQFDITSMLLGGGIYQSDTKSYTYDEIFKTVKGVVGTNPTLTCVYDQKTKRVYLSQIEFCMDRQFSMTDCVPVTRTSSDRKKLGRNLRDEDCSHEKDIFYPPKKLTASNQPPSPPLPVPVSL